MSEKNKIYLGDGAYIERDGHEFILTTSDGIEDTNSIYLDLEAIVLMAKFAELKIED